MARSTPPRWPSSCGRWRSPSRIGCPVLTLVESGGADLPRQADIFVPGGRIFRELTRLSAAGIPTISLVFGSSTAGGAYVPGLSEYTVLVADAATVYLGGPPLVKMAINEDIDDESLGGADMHARVSGLADYLAADEREAILIGRQIVADLGWRKAGPEPSLPADPPIHDAAELLGCTSADPKRAVEVREILARILDGSRFSEFKPLYGTQLVCGWGSIAGYPVGILANNGILFSAESNKGAHFIQLANARNIPLLFVQNITGFMVGSAAERGGIIKDGAKLINAVVELRRPAPDPDGRGVLRRGQLRHVGAGLRPAVRLHLAEPPDRGDGRHPTGRCDVDRRARRRGACRAVLRRTDRCPRPRRDRADDRGAVQCRLRHRPAVGRRRDRSPRHPRRCCPSPSPPSIPRP